MPNTDINAALDRDGQINGTLSATESLNGSLSVDSPINGSIAMSRTYQGGWNALTGKPFSTLGDDFSVNDDDELELSDTVAEKIAVIDDLADVATSGSYNDLSDRPTLFSGNYNDLTNKPNLSTVATSGSYNDLSNKPNLSTVATSGSYYDLKDLPPIEISPSGKLTLFYSGKKVFEFIENDGYDVDAILPLPTWDEISSKPFVSLGDDFSVDNGIVELANTIPTKTSELTNDSGFLTEHQDISNKADKATTLAGYGITNAYTKTEIDTKIGDVETLLAAL